MDDSYPSVIDIATDSDRESSFSFHCVAQGNFGSGCFCVRLVAEFNESDRQGNQESSYENIENTSDVAQRQFVS